MRGPIGPALPVLGYRCRRREARAVKRAELYGVESRSLVQAVKRNVERFPRDFMFQLEPREVADLKSQIVISSWGGSRSRPYAFTEQGVAMLSSVLHYLARRR